MIHRKMHIFFLAILTLIQTACQKADDDPDPANPDVPENMATPEYKNYMLETDKAFYHPGEEVVFSLGNTFSLPENAKVRYKYQDSIVGEALVSDGTWSWTTPENDFSGYIAEVRSGDETDAIIYATVGIDVSSDWTRFPRYGFLSKYPPLSEQETDEVIERLNRYHINGLQFYDWHHKHHNPLPVENGTPLSSWKDIIQRDIYLETVKNYIESAHEKNMKAMFYNLIYGAWKDAEEDGVKKEWYIFTDNTHTNYDFHPLPSPPFQSNIFLLDPSNSEWQQYLLDEHQKVYAHLNFDGFHMDQLGDRGSRYTYDGDALDLAQTFHPFIEAMSAGNPDKKLVMNAVNQYGQQEIAQAPTDFLYTEVWSPHDTYQDLASIIRLNNLHSDNTKNTVLAAYMNYDLADDQGYFNTPAVLMTDAVIFAFGGAHLELGEHMLGKEYFPNDNLKMKGDLQAALPDYYDFLVAYQNLLRDGGTFNSLTLQSLDGKLPVAAWPGGLGSVASVCRKVGNKQVIHLINFKDSKTSEWRDNRGIQAIPALIRDAGLTIQVPTLVRKVWTASPDMIGGASRALNFEQSNDQVAITLPELKYWSMIVLEYEQ